MNTKPLHPETNIRIALRAIAAGEVVPVTKIGKSYYQFADDQTNIGNVTYTQFTEEGVPVESWNVRYGSYHTLHQIVANPLPKQKLAEVFHTELPENLSLVMTVGQILKSYN